MLFILKFLKIKYAISLFIKYVNTKMPLFRMNVLIISVFRNFRDKLKFSQYSENILGSIYWVEI